MRWLLALLALGAGSPALAEPLAMTKSVTFVSDPLGSSVPRSIPGAVADYRTTAVNPLLNATKPVRDLVIVEQVPASLVLRVSDLAGAGKGPLECSLGIGLGASGLTYAYSALTSPTDGLEFSNGTDWTYQPVADADGYDANVRAVRITLGSTFATGASFQLRYRVKIR